MVISAECLVFGCLIFAAAYQYMVKNLVIVESPAKAKTIGRFLGEDFKVMSSYGHIRDLRTNGMSINEETFVPDYVVPDDKKRIVGELRKASKEAGTVWLASDEDREGEAIAWHLASVLGLDVLTTRRIVFHEITRPAIEAALLSPRTIDMNLVNAQQARRVLDRIVGFKLSPVLWRRIRRGLSAGRVQSVAVRLVVAREKEIRDFSATRSFAIVGQFRVGGAVVKAELGRRFESEEEARAFLESLAGATFRIGEVESKEVSRSPAPPFMTSTLQQEAARKFGFPVALTMRLAQGLYERGLITYMRTDSLNLSSLCLGSSKKLIVERLGSEYSKTRRFHTRAKGAQEAHEAIRPTFMENESIEGTLQEQKLYSLIWKRTIAGQMSDAVFEKTTATVLIDGRSETFRVEGEVLKFDGFLRVYQVSHDDEDEAGAAAQLPPLAAGQPLEQVEIVGEERFSQRPPRYNEASLVHKLEELGIGRPSTYAPTISTIQQRGYVSRESRPGVEREQTVLRLKGGKIERKVKKETAYADKQKLVPTDVGMVVTDYLEAEFPDILDYGFTARVEKSFDSVAAGKEEWTGLMRRFYERFVPTVDRAMEEKSQLRVGERILGTDPKTGRQVSVKIGRFGPMVQLGTNTDEEKPAFASLPKGATMDGITIEEALELFRLPRKLGEMDGQEVKAGSGRFGPYVQWGKLFASIPKGGDPLTIGFDEACELIRKKQEAEAASHLKTFAEEPEMEVRQGRFGPYLVYKGQNYKLPAGAKERAKELTLEECRAIVGNARPSGAKGRRSRRG